MMPRPMTPTVPLRPEVMLLLTAGFRTRRYDTRYAAAQAAFSRDADRLSSAPGWKREECRMRICVAGIGKMGAAIAARLIEVGHDVAVWNRTPQKAKTVVGAIAVGTPAELV